MEKEKDLKYWGGTASSTAADVYYTSTASSGTDASGDIYKLKLSVDADSSSWLHATGVWKSSLGQLETEEQMGIRTQTWSGNKLLLSSYLMNDNVFPVGTLPLSVNNGFMLPVAGKIAVPAIEESLLMLAGMSDDDLSRLVGTSVKYASMLMPRIKNSLVSMLELFGSEIAPGYCRGHNGSLVAIGSICKYIAPKRKSKFREAMEKLPIAGLSAMLVDQSAQVKFGVEIKEYGGSYRATDYGSFNSFFGTAVPAQPLPLVILYEVTESNNYWLSKRIYNDQTVFDQYIDIERFGKQGHDGVYFIFMRDTSPHIIGPVTSETDLSVFRDELMIMDDQSVPYEISKKVYTAALKELIRFCDEAGPVHFVSYTDSYRLGIADMRNVIAAAEDTGSTFSFQFSSPYRGLTSYARNLFEQEFAESIFKRSTSGRSTPGAVVSSINGMASRTLAYLIPEESFTVFTTTAKPTLEFLSNALKSKYIYMASTSKDVTPDDKRLVAGRIRMFSNIKNSVGVLLDRVNPAGPIFRMIGPTDEISSNQWGIALKNSQEELLAQL